LLPKSGDSKYVRIYQPITCLTTICRTIRRIARRISTTLEEQSLLPAEKKGSHPGTNRCKDQLMTPKAIYGNCKMRNKNLNAAFINHQKHFAALHITQYKVHTTSRSEQENCKFVNC